MSRYSNVASGQQLPSTLLPGVGPSWMAEGSTKDANVSRGITSHIQRLPEELLCSIFAEYVECGNSPWCLTLVCQKWYNAALSYHRLWANICIERSPEEEKTWTIPRIAKPVKSSAQYQVCSLRKDLKEAIERSGTAELVVVIWIPQIGENALKLMKELLVPGVADRICHLVIDIDMQLSGQDPSLLNKLCKLFSHAPLTHLRTIDLYPMNNCETTKFIVNDIINNAEDIQEASLDLSLLRSIIPTIHDSFWNRLRQLKGYPIYLTNPSSHFHAVSLCTKLENLELPWIEGEVPHLTLDTITSLTIETNPSFANLSLPRLESLQITMRPRWPNNEFQTTREVTYPALKSLEVSSPDLVWMSKYHLPVLENLSIVTTVQGPKKKKERFLKFFSDRSFPTIRQLKICSGCREEEFISALKAVPNVQELFLIPGGDPAIHFGSKLFARLEVMPRGKLVCKELKVMNVVATIRKVDARMAKKMRDFRAKAGHPLESLDIVSRGANGQELITRLVK